MDERIETWSRISKWRNSAIRKTTEGKGERRERERGREKAERNEIVPKEKSHFVVENTKLEHFYCPDQEPLTHWGCGSRRLEAE